MHHHPMLISFFLFLFSSNSLAYHFKSSNVEFESDKQSLIAFKNSIRSDYSNVFANWLPTIHLCNWTGVTCHSAVHRVQSLILGSEKLEGFISPSIGNLSFITHIDLFNNSFTGQIPQELGRLHHLKYLNLAVNKFEGPIPKNLTACKELEKLSLAANHLSGTIPPEFGWLTSLEILQLGANNLTGGIPSSLGNLSYLKMLALQDNNLGGHIPPELGRLTQLSSLVIFENPLLTGPIPPSLSNITNLTELALNSNNLIGTIPPELGKLTQLTVLYLWGNCLRGTIPSTLANCSQLVALDLGLNRLTGMVPLDFSRLSRLKLLDLYDNQLVSGSSKTIPILSSLANCTHLSEIDLSRNQLAGSLPEQLPTNLAMLWLKGNNITGDIPSKISSLTNLADLDLSSNLFTGQVPSSLRRLGNLQRLWLDNNQLEGSIPREIGEITTLGLLSMSHNMLSGEIPDTIAHLQQLTQLELHHNQLSGNITAGLGKCRRLQLLDLSHNQFRGHLPSEVINLPDLQFYFNLSRNSLHGPLPLEIGNMIHVLAIDISANRLEGHIPATLDGCQELQQLKLSSNGLQGPIPNSIGKIKSLVDVDLSFNNLSGMVPVSLKTLSMLEHLNLSFNNLTGEIPKGVFKNSTVLSFTGNPFLCGEWMNFPACSIPSRGQKNINKNRIIAPVLGVSSFVLCCFLLWLNSYWRSHRHKQKIDVSEDISTQNLMAHRAISYQEVVRATDGFKQENLLGTGGFSSVYKGILDDGTVAAIKLLNLQIENSGKNFIAECKVLGRARHRNLVKVLTYCSESVNKVLVLQFMSRGNLANLLFTNGQVLSFKKILNIAIDVIHGLEYLHHDCFVQIVHCDIKPSNILLDEDMTAHLADFGIAHIISEPDSMESLTSTLALKGSIGYIAPEYGSSGRVSTAGDIYSYGIMLLEMITKKSPTNDLFVGEVNLHNWVSMHFPDRVEKIVDRNVMRGIGQYEIQKGLIPFMHIGLVCSKESPPERPTAREVSRALESIRTSIL